MQPDNQQPLLQLQHVNKRFGGVIAANDVSFNVYAGRIHGLIGPNGAGKTTLLNLISGIYEVDSGSIHFQGKDITKMPSHNRARMGLGRTFQAPRFLYRSSIRDNLLLGTDLADQMGYFKSFIGKRGYDFYREFDELMDIVGFRLNFDDDINSLPYGNRKLLEIVRTLLSHPVCILVDEPVAGLNNKESEIVVRLLKYAAEERKIGIVLIEHLMDLVMNVCENIVVLNFGQVIANGTPQEVSTNKDVIEAYLGGGTDFADNS